jgi:hypothetical protein
MHTFTTHGDTIRNSYSVVLPCEHVVLLNVLLDFLAQPKHYL